MMQARMKNPVLLFPEASQAIADLNAVVEGSSLAPATRNLARLRASQINGSTSCIHQASKQAREAGETEVRLIGLTGWRQAPYYTGAERAALALTEEVTRLQGTEPVPDHVWHDASKHFDEDAISALLLTITITNATNRFTISTRQVAGS